MKHAAVILACLAVFYAGVMRALENCHVLTAQAVNHHAEEEVSPHSHAGDGESHHSHSNSSQIHCPDVFGAFIAGFRTSIQQHRIFGRSAGPAAQWIASLHSGSPSDYRTLSPPDRSSFRMTALRHFLSVFRI
ncbi:MAG TPA: hypothetical protein VLA17_07400 [Candidatus Limnocylindria bacterium]|nr:hypothetical protein [Candidatus Limnocylindria bacterium]